METEQLTIEGAPMAPGTTVTIEKLRLNKIRLNRNSRLNIDPDELEGLMQSIKSEGLLQPIGVVKKGNDYEICYGNRRFMACSKLGMTTIPAIVHTKKKESDVDIKNLTENVQRRNVSLSEVGRYIELLEKQGLSRGEAGVRLGVSKSYVKNALEAFQNVPKEFREDIEVRINGGSHKSTSTRTAPGKISASVVAQIVSCTKSGIISDAESKLLYAAAKSRADFMPMKVREYAKAIAAGTKDFIKAVPKEKFIQVSFVITEKEYDRLMREYVKDGPFNGFNALVVAILRGEKAITIKARAKGRYGTYKSEE